MKKHTRRLKKRWIVLPVVFAAAAVSSVLGIRSCSKTPSAHYELSDELRLTFDNADYIIEEMRAALSRHDYRIYLTYHAQDGYMDDVLPLVDELMNYAMAETEDPTQGDYIRYQSGGYDIFWNHEEGEDDWTYSLTITPVYYTKLAQEERVDQDIEEILEEMHFTSQTTDYEKVRAIYEYICANVSYDTIHKSDQYHLKSTAYAALERKIAGCQGYAVLMYRLLKESGISCRVITGIGEYEGKEEFHAWNIVELDGLYYNLDATWDARLGEDTYFLKGSETFTEHTPDEKFTAEEFLAAYPMSAEDY